MSTGMQPSKKTKSKILSSKIWILNLSWKCIGISKSSVFLITSGGLLKASSKDLMKACRRPWVAYWAIQIYNTRLSKISEVIHLHCQDLSCCINLRAAFRTMSAVNIQNWGAEIPFWQHYLSIEFWNHQGVNHQVWKVVLVKNDWTGTVYSYSSPATISLLIRSGVESRPNSKPGVNKWKGNFLTFHQPFWLIPSPCMSLIADVWFDNTILMSMNYHWHAECSFEPFAPEWNHASKRLNLKASFGRFFLAAAKANWFSLFQFYLGFLLLVFRTMWNNYDRRFCKINLIEEKHLTRIPLSLDIVHIFSTTILIKYLPQYPIPHTLNQLYTLNPSGRGWGYCDKFESWNTMIGPRRFWMDCLASEMLQALVFSIRIHLPCSFTRVKLESMCIACK